MIRGGPTTIIYRYHYHYLPLSLFTITTIYDYYIIVTVTISFPYDDGGYIRVYYGASFIPHFLFHFSSFSDGFRYHVSNLLLFLLGGGRASRALWATSNRSLTVWKCSIRSRHSSGFLFFK